MESVAGHICPERGRKKRLELLTYFLMDFSDKTANEKRMFDCEICKKQEWYTTRTCFKFTERVYFDVPVLEWVAGKAARTKEDKRVGVGIDGFYKLLREFQEWSPDMPLAELLDRHFRDVCPKSVLDLRYMEWIRMEAFCKEYGCLLFEGGMMDQPYVEVEIMNIIRGTRSDYEIRQQKEMRRKMDAKSSQSQNVRTR